MRENLDAQDIELRPEEIESIDEIAAEPKPDFRDKVVGAEPVNDVGSGAGSLSLRHS